MPSSSRCAGHSAEHSPRKDILILENPEGTIKNAGWFNIWAINAGSQSNGLQQVGLDTLWYIDPESGLDGVWDNSLASDKPIYNADFTEMTAKLRKGIFWSDGVEFTADDVIYTVETQIKNPAMRFGAVLANNVAAVEAPDTLHRGLQAEEAELALPRQLHRALGAASGSCRSTSSRRSRTRPSSTSTSRSPSAPTR